MYFKKKLEMKFKIPFFLILITSCLNNLDKKETLINIKKPLKIQLEKKKKLNKEKTLINMKKPLMDDFNLDLNNNNNYTGSARLLKIQLEKKKINRGYRLDLKLIIKNIFNKKLFYMERFQLDSCPEEINIPIKFFWYDGSYTKSNYPFQPVKVILNPKETKEYLIPLYFRATNGEWSRVISSGLKKLSCIFYYTFKELVYEDIKNRYISNSLLEKVDINFSLD